MNGIASSNNLIDNNSKKFVSKEILEKFKKYVDGEKSLQLNTEGGKKEKKIKDLTINDEIISIEIDIFVTGLDLVGDAKNLKTSESNYDELKRDYEAREEQLAKSYSELEAKLDSLQKSKDRVIAEKKLIQQDLITAKKAINNLEQELTSEQEQRAIAENNFANEKEQNQLLRENNAILVQKSALEENRRKLEDQLKEQNSDKEINEIKRQLRDTEEKLAKSENELDAKQKEIDKMAKQIEEKQKKEKESAPTERLETILDDLENSFKRLENYQNKEDRLDKLTPRLVMSKIKINASDLGTISRGVNYVGGGLSTIGYGEIGGGLTLVASTVDSIVSEIENSDKQKQEELVKLEGTCQELKKIYNNFNKSLVLPKRMDETISNFLELVNDLQKSISSDAEQKEVNKKFEKLKIEVEEVKNDLKKVIKDLEAKTDSSQVIKPGQITVGSSKNNNQEEELQAVIVHNELTPLLPKK
ncbi:16102_t:CDS:2 [Entrophospora sp. SA101]|nr:16102_t:CDS:2 [Entrophospora sp. SA101]CAJ0824724.1 6763_t:CDS:2 [Entrophospora sp. SA101]